MCAFHVSGFSAIVVTSLESIFWKIFVAKFIITTPSITFKHKSVKFYVVSM